MLALIGALAAGMAVVFGALTILRRREAFIPSGADARLAELKAQDLAGLAPQPIPGIIRPVAAGIGYLLAGLLPSHLMARVEADVEAAGRPVAASRIVLLSCVLAPALALLTFAFVRAAVHPSPVLLFLIVAAAFGAGLYLPLFWLRRKVTKRRLEIWRGLPDASDLLTTCVEAGMGIDSAFARVASEMSGPLSIEIAAMLQEIALGRPRQEAMAAVGARTQVPDLQGMLTAVIQADKTGARLAPVLRAQARYIRTERKLWAEERARKVPAKMTFAIIFLIVPTLFLLILGPLVVEILDTFTIV